MNVQKERYDLLVRGGTVVTPDRLMERGVVASRGGRIAYVGAAPPAGIAAEGELDATGCWVVPGLIDMHVHGAGGYDLARDETPQVSAVLAAHGVTGFLATLGPEPLSSLLIKLPALAAAVDADLPGARLLGVHLEGPFLSTKQPGCLDPTLFRVPDRQEANRLVVAAGGALKRMTLAVELPGAKELIADLIRSGVDPSLGHSDASFEAVLEAVSLGVRQATHTFNAMSGLHHRAPGAVGAVLHAHGVLAEVIADGQHVHHATVELIYRQKGPRRIALVSDAVPASALPPGRYEWAGREVLCDGQSCRMPDGQLAGSALLLDGGLAFLTLSCGIPVSDAVAMAARTPAVALGLGDRKGSLSAGMDADVAVFDSAWRCQATIVGGQLKWPSS